MDENRIWEWSIKGSNLDILYFICLLDSICCFFFSNDHLQHCCTVGKSGLALGLSSLWFMVPKVIIPTVLCMYISFRIWMVGLFFSFLGYSWEWIFWCKALNSALEILLSSPLLASVFFFFFLQYYSCFFGPLKRGHFNWLLMQFFLY